MKPVKITDCIPCILRQIGVFEATPHYPRVTCRHLKNGAWTPGLKSNKFSEALVSHLNMAVIFGALCISLGEIDDDTERVSLTLFYHKLLDFIVLVLALLTAVIFYYEKSKNLLQVSYLIQLVNKRRVFGIARMFSERFTKSFVRINVLLFQFNNLFFCGRTCFFIVSGRFAPKVVVYQIGTALSFFLLINMGTYIVDCVVLYWYIFRRNFKVVRKELEAAKNDGKKPASLSNCLHRLQLFYLRLASNYEGYMLSFANIIYYIAIFVGICSLGVSWCLFLSSIDFGGKEGWIALFDVMGKHHRLMLIFLVFCVFTEKTSTSIEDLISYLYKYKITELSPLEAAQVETFITILTLRKPELRASDIFTVGTNLLSSIFGTVITYVLVALQFYASFSK